jgi:hypothetical protein
LRIKTARLKSLRLAKEAADKEPAAKIKQSETPITTKATATGKKRSP